MALRRRDLFRLGGIGGALGIGAGFAGVRWFGAKQTRPPAPTALDCASDPATASADYRARYAPPPSLIAGSRDGLHTPPARTASAATPRIFDLPIVESMLEVANGQQLMVWSYGGSVPGPILRATLGDTLQVRLDNRSSSAHNLHFHGSHDVMQDGLGRVAPGARQDYEFEAGPVGFHPYHCHVPPYARHISRGMYGALIVDPPAGRPAAHEFVLCLCGFDTDGDGHNDVYGWNGMAGYYDRFPLKVPAGELVRLYVMNMVEYEPLASFHLHAQTFDLYRSGTSLVPHEHTDVVSLGPAERAILEFRLPRRGRYMFHPHQIHMAERGAMGWIVAI